MASQFLRTITPLECDTYDNLVLAEAAGEASHDAMVWVQESTRFGWYRWSDDDQIWKRGAGRITSIDSATPMSMASGILTMDMATAEQDGYLISADWATFTAKADAPTVESLQQDLSDLTNNFNLLLKFVITQFNEIPDGLESSFEDAMSAV